MTLSPIKVTVLTTSYPLADGAISGIFVARLVEHYGNDVQIDVLTPAHQENTTPVSYNRITIKPFRYAPKPWQILAQNPGGIPVALHDKPWLYFLLPGFLAAMLIACLKQAPYTDVFHSNWAICGCIAGIAGWFWRIPVVTTLRGQDVTRARTSWIDRLILKCAARMSSRLVCVSVAIRAWVSEQMPSRSGAATLIENGVDNCFLQAGDKRLIRTGGQPLRLLTVGSLIPRKGMDVVIKAIGILSAPPGILTLEIVGSGPERERLASMVDRKKLHRSIRFAGELDPVAVAGKYADADVFILASRDEGRPNVILEAMAAGLPVIGSDIDGIDELVEHEHTGLLFQEGSVMELAQALQRVIDNPQMRNAMGKAGRRTIDRKGLHWHNTAAKYTRLYRELLGERW